MSREIRLSRMILAAFVVLVGVTVTGSRSFAGCEVEVEPNDTVADGTANDSFNYAPSLFGTNGSGTLEGGGTDRWFYRNVAGGTRTITVTGNAKAGQCVIVTVIKCTAIVDNWAACPFDHRETQFENYACSGGGIGLFTWTYNHLAQVIITHSVLYPGTVNYGFGLSG